MKIICESNNDVLRMEKWPDRFIKTPVVGDFIESVGRRSIGRVHMVTHCMGTTYTGDVGTEPEPYIRLYLVPLGE